MPEWEINMSTVDQQRVSACPNNRGCQSDTHPQQCWMLRQRGRKNSGAFTAKKYWPGLGLFSSVAQSCPTLCNLMDCSTLGLPVHHLLLEFTQTHIQWVCDAIQPSHPLLSPSPSAFSLPQHQGLFRWVSSSLQVAKVLELELQLQHQSFQRMFRTDFL